MRPVGLKIWKGGPGKKKQNNKKKQSYGCWNTLMEEYTAPVQKWRLLPRFLGQEWTFSPVKAPITTLHWAYHIRWLDQALKNVISNKDCRVPYCETAPLSNLTCLSRSIESHTHTVIRSFKSNSYIHAFMHPHRFFHVFTHSCVHLHMHNINLHMTASVAQSLSQQWPFGSVLNHFKWQVQTNEQLETFPSVTP